MKAKISPTSRKGFMPSRRVKSKPVKQLDESQFEEFYAGTDDREVSTTMVFVRILAKLLRDKEVGNLVVPIVPDEARTFGMEALFRQVGIYSNVGQLYDPVDRESLLYYKEAKNGQILEEGITESGSMSSFIAAGTAYSTHNVNTIHFYIFYSMFGLQRIGDLVWAAGDMQVRGFLLGGTAGRTTLAGEGLQHQDGNSHILVFYYITVMNENYAQPAMPKGKAVKEGIIKGMYKLSASKKKNAKGYANLFGSGSILNKAVLARDILEKKYNIAADVWSVTSYKELHYDAIKVERENMLNPGKKAKLPYVAEALKDAKGVFVAASDYVRALPESIAKWVPGKLFTLGADGFGRSDGRRHLREFFEVDERFIVLAALYQLMQEGTVKDDLVKKAIKDMDIDTNKSNPIIS
ncbi:MAG: hypothetical protein P8X42_19475 [Calditrichaceae bacterium]